MIKYDLLIEFIGKKGKKNNNCFKISEDGGGKGNKTKLSGQVISHKNGLYLDFYFSLTLKKNPSIFIIIGGCDVWFER